MMDFFPIFLNSCGTDSCKSLVSFSIFLHHFAEAEGAPGSCRLCIFCVAFAYEQFYAMQYLGAFHWALKESSAFLAWY